MGGRSIDGESALPSWMLWLEDNEPARRRKLAPFSRSLQSSHNGWAALHARLICHLAWNIDSSSTRLLSEGLGFVRLASRLARVPSRGLTHSYANER